jgi:demethylmenaquinone methyltransferase/2-methoxy-6-polyprenyl-1,4-benzoquinol methylase
MIEANKVKAFFNRLAPEWDAHTVRDEAVIEAILDAAEIGAGMHILVVACGTGVLIPDYLNRGAASVTGADISETMAEIARGKFQNDARVTILCANAETADFQRQFDRIVIYDALPHFADVDGLISHLSGFLRPGGMLTIAHDRSRENINAHHKGMPSFLAVDLLPADALAAIFARSLDVVSVVSDDRMYQVVGKQRG